MLSNGNFKIKDQLQSQANRSLLDQLLMTMTKPLHLYRNLKRNTRWRWKFIQL